MKNQKKLIIAGISGIALIILIVLVRCVDTAPIGPENTVIGLSHLNQAVNEKLGTHMIWYTVTDYLGILAILTACIFGFIGLVQFIRTKDLKKVDKDILLLGGLYLITIGIYVLFEIVIVNYRQIIMPGDAHPEASFPSSHTMVICVIMASTQMVLDRYVRSETLCRILRVLCGIVLCVTVVGRLISGVHWFTDILGGLLISILLLSLFSAARTLIGEAQQER